MDSLNQITDRIPNLNHLFISLTGGGGKTTLMQSLARHYQKMGKTVLMTTTTKIQSPDNYKWNTDFVFLTDEIFTFTLEKPCVVLYAQKTDDSLKLTSPGLEKLEKLKQKFDVVICEADGSRQLPIKIHTDKDPVIPCFSDFTICIVGSWAWEKPVKDVVFGYRLEDKDRIVDSSFIEYYLSDSQGLLKGTNYGQRLIFVS